jgi:hypothetical protein
MVVKLKMFTVTIMMLVLRTDVKLLLDVFTLQNPAMIMMLAQMMIVISLKDVPTIL